MAQTRFFLAVGPHSRPPYPPAIRAAAAPPGNKTARLPYVDPSTEHARTFHHPQASDTRWGAEKKQGSRMPLGRREWAARQAATGPLAASPRPCSMGCGRAAGTPQRERFARGEHSGHA
jgi:hypothetical protein